MKKILSIAFLCSVSLSAAYDINQLLAIAVAEKNGDLFTNLAMTMPEADRAKASFRSKIKTVGLTDAAFDANLKAKQKALGYAGGAAAPSQAQIDAQVDARVKDEMKKLSINVPEINTTGQAKDELVKFIDNGTGADLLAATYGKNSPKDAVVKLLKAAPAA